MNRTAEILYRPDGWTSKILLLHIEDFAERIGKSRREVDRMAEDGELDKFIVLGLSCIPAHELQKFGQDSNDKEGAHGDRREHQAAGTAAGTGTETESRTPWEELSYEPR